MNARIRISVFAALLAAQVLGGCASQGKPPPGISLDEPVQAQPLPEPAKPIEVVSVPEPLALPDQLKPLPITSEPATAPEPTDEKLRVSRANEEARVAPTREGYVNAIQVWPYSDGALYQVYAAPGRVTVISLQPGRQGTRCAGSWATRPAVLGIPCASMFWSSRSAKVLRPIW